MKFTFPLAIALFGALAGAVASPALADDHNHDPTKRCGWVQDYAPAFVAGQTSYIATSRTMRRSVIFNEVIGIEAYSVVVLPGYQYGFAYAMDNGVPNNSSVTVACARSADFAVTRSQICCAPIPTVSPKITGWFRVRARVLNAPASAYAAGTTIVVGRNTGVTLVLGAAVSTDPNAGGTTIGVEVPGPGGTKLKKSITVDFDDEDESVDEVSRQSPTGTFAVPDEEYFIDTDIDLEASADGAPWDEGEGAADLTRHTLVFDTSVGCTHCGVTALFHKKVDAAFFGCSEGTP